MRSLSERVTKLEAFQEVMDTQTIPSIQVAVKTEIPSHYTKRIAESEKMMKMSIAEIIEQKLDKRFGWLPRILETIFTGVIVALIIYGAGLA